MQKKKEERKKFGRGFHIILFLLVLVMGIVFSYFHLIPIFVSIYFAFVVIYGFYVFDVLFNINFKLKHYIFMIIIVLTGPALLILFYQVFFYSDKILHYLHPILLSSIVFFIVSKLKIKKSYALFITAFIVFGSFAIFEVIEYVVDFFLNIGMQGAYLRDISGVIISQVAVLDPLTDTMTDLILGLLGSLTYMIYGILRFRD